MALLLPTYHRSTTQSCLLLTDMSVTNKETKATDTSNPLKNVTVFVEDLATASQFAPIIHAPHTADPPGRWGILKGFAGAFRMKALDRRFVYDLQKEMRKSMIALTAYFASEGSPCKEKCQLLFQFNLFTIFVRRQHLFRVYSALV